MISVGTFLSKANHFNIFHSIYRILETFQIKDQSCSHSIGVHGVTEIMINYISLNCSDLDMFIVTIPD